MALELLPLPNTEVAGRSTGILRVEGRFNPNEPFRIDSENNANLARFGGYDSVPWGPFPTAKAGYKLYVDGVLIAGGETEYDVISYPVP